ncbi:two-component response regulator ARR12-like [Rhododendron vialii]|uniref:two-component response regulator ARR12-like n=1 Tax=Rhododendron vialii TaxID=182163 RepID=UPI00265F03A7|nr:two-component response regulator ARR12-like [Rhododendron vialii]
MAGEMVTPNQSSQTSGKPMGSISVLVVDDDTTCLAIVSAILKSWQYEVVTVKHAIEALCTLQVTGGAFDLVVIDVHMPDMNGFELQKKIDEEYNLPVVFMSADDQESVILRGLQSGAAFFLVKPISPNDLKNLWQYAVAKKKPKSAHIEVIESARETSKTDKRPSSPTNVFLHPTASAGRLAPFSKGPDHSLVQETSENEKGSNGEVGSGLSLRNEDRRNTRDSKRKSPATVEEGENEDDSGNPKKTKIVWTNALHNQFLEAIRCVGIERAVPKKILELMNVPGLTRENIASHLQKYRIFLKRVSEASTKIQSASERSMIERTFRSNFAMAQPSLLHKKPQFQCLRNLDRAPLGKSLQPDLSNYSNQKFAPSTDSPPVFGSGQSRLLLNQTNFKQPLAGGVNPGLHHQANSSSIRTEPSDHPTGLLLNGNGNGNVSGGIMNSATFMQPYQQKDHVALESVTNDHITGYGNIGDFSSSNLNPSPNYQNNTSYVGLRLASDGRLVGLSTDLNPNHGSINVVQSESTSNVPVLNDCFDDYLNPNHGSINVVQSESTGNVLVLNDIFDDYLNPNHGSINVVQSESTGNVLVLNDSFDDYLNPNHGSINVVQSGSTSNVPVLNDSFNDYLNPNHGSINVVQSESTGNVLVLNDSFDDYLNPNHGSINVVQSGSTSNVPVLNDSFNDYLNPNHGSINVVQSGSTSNIPVLNDSFDDYLNPNHGLINVVQSGSTSSVPVLNDSFDDYLGQGVLSSTGLESGCYVSAATLGNVIQDGNTLTVPLSPPIMLENAFGNEGESDYIFGALLDNNVVTNNIREINSNPNIFLQPYGECGFGIPSEINFIQTPIQDDVEVLNSAFSFSPDDHVENNPIANINIGQYLEQPLGREMMFSDFGIDGGDEYFPALGQTFDQFPQLEDEDFLEPMLFGASEFNGYDKP